MKKIFLYGHLEERFGREHRFSIDTTAEAIRALEANFTGFHMALREGYYQVIRGDRITGEALSQEGLLLTLGGADLHIVPVAEGAGGDNKGIITALLGIVIVATAFFTAGGSLAALGGTAFTLPAGLGAITYGQIAAFGLMLTLSGVSQMLAPSAKIDDYGALEDADKRKSFVFNGPINTMEQGGALPVVYGRMRVGSCVVNAGIEVRESSNNPHDPHCMVAPDTNRYLVTVVLGDGAESSPGTEYVLDGESSVQEFTVSWPYYITDVKLDGVSQGPMESITVSNITADIEIEVVTGETD